MLSVKLPDADVPEAALVFIFAQLLAFGTPPLSVVRQSSTCFNSLLSVTVQLAVIGLFVFTVVWLMLKEVTYGDVASV